MALPVERQAMSHVSATLTIERDGDEIEVRLRGCKSTNWFVYALTDPRDGEVRYIGVCINPFKRLRSEIIEAIRGKQTPKSEWVRELIQAGESPVLVEVWNGRTKREAIFKEADTIKSSTNDRLLNRRLSPFACGRIIHGASKTGEKTRTYCIWEGMKKRCLDPKSVSYPRYGALGITVCAKWKNSFEAFLSDMGECPEGLSIDRFPNKTGNYEPGNCRWATMVEQNNNRKDNVVIEFDGQSMTVAQWTRYLGFGRHVIYDRLESGWSIEKALLTPSKNAKTAI